MIKKFLGRVTAVSLYADNKYRITIDGDDGVGYSQIVCSRDEAHSFQDKLGHKIQIQIEFSEMESPYANVI